MNLSARVNPLEPEPAASWPALYRSAIVKKAIMAASGGVLFGFVLLHMLGNLKLYLGPQKLNAYAEWLRELGTPLFPHSGVLWLLRGVLLLAVVLHVLSAWELTRASRAARPVAYRRRATLQASYASRTMRWGGVILALFVVYHLAHFTWGWRWAHPGFVPGDVYHNVVAGFRVWWVSGLYVVAQVALGLHLYHGLFSMVPSLGWARPARARRRFAGTFAVVVTAGNVSFPLAVLSGVVS
jgi:succinate dehydrogenase / fumarate reductase cytochrome b subunit